jgi:hypothetical protein
MSTFEIHTETTLPKKYELNKNDKIIDLKNKILNDLFQNQYTNIDLYNVNERVYKDFGKLFFDKGLLPSTINKYPIESFTSENRTFIFKAVANNDTDLNKQITYKISEEPQNKKFKYNHSKKVDFNIDINNVNEFPPLR